MNQNTIDRALEAAAVAAETWNLEKHGSCAELFFHRGHTPREFDCDQPYTGPTEHG
jgi:hypothetical protein